MHGVRRGPVLGSPQAWVDVASYLNRAPFDRATLQGNGSQIALGRGIFHEQCASSHQADAVADYLSRLRGPGRQRKAMRDNGVVVD